MATREGLGFLPVLDVKGDTKVFQGKRACCFDPAGCLGSRVPEMSPNRQINDGLLKG